MRLTMYSFSQTEPRVFCTEQDKSFLTDILVPKNKRPSHRLPVFSWMPFSLPFIGKKVDTIEWARQELTETNQALRQARHQLARDVSTTTDLPAEHTHDPDVFSADPDTAQTYPPTYCCNADASNPGYVPNVRCIIVRLLGYYSIRPCSSLIWALSLNLPP